MEITYAKWVIFVNQIFIFLHKYDDLMNILIKIEVNSANPVNLYENYIFKKDPYPIYTGHPPLKKSVF